MDVFWALAGVLLGNTCRFHRDFEAPPATGYHPTPGSPDAVHLNWRVLVLSSSSGSPHMSFSAGCRLGCRHLRDLFVQRIPNLPHQHF
jgi:hypothetical protein